MILPADAPFVSRPAPNLIAGLLALGVHALFVLLLVFGVSWQTQHPAPVMVDLWEALPEPRPAVAKPARPIPKPARPVPVPKAEEPPQPKAPDIALEKKKNEAAHLKRLQAIEAAEEKARAEAARKKQLAEQKKRDLLRQMEEEERRATDEVAASEARKQAATRVASKRQAEAMRIADQYGEMISAKVRGNARLPENLKGKLEVRYQVKLLPTGEVVAVRRARSSGNEAFDEAVERAIHKSSPLPLPSDREARAEFVPEFTLIHSP
jgi:colicin import membrane protein